MANKHFIGLALACIGFLPHGTALADRYTFEPVTQTGDFEGISHASMNNNGDVVFTAQVRDQEFGIYTGPNYETDLVVGSSNFERLLYPDINDHGEIVFYGEPELSVGAIYRFREGVLNEVARPGDDFVRFVPTGFLDPVIDPPPPKINNNGDIAFFAYAVEADGSLFSGVFSGPDPLNDIWVHGEVDANGLQWPNQAYLFDINDREEIGFVTNIEHVAPNGTVVPSTAVMKGTDRNFEQVIVGVCALVQIEPNCVELPPETKIPTGGPFIGVSNINEAGDLSFFSGYTSKGEVLSLNPFSSGRLILDGNSTPVFEGKLSSDGGLFDGPRGVIAGDHPIADLVFAFNDEINGKTVSKANIVDVNEAGKILLLHDGNILTIATPHPVPLGDFDNDTLLTPRDIDILSSAIRDGSEKPLFDLNDDELVDAGDRVIWVQDLADTLFGDADLDKDVDIGDFLLLSSSFGQDAGWNAGDFLGDGTVGFDDFLELSNQFGNSTNVATAPEPSFRAWLIILVCFARTNRRHTNR